jgi:hypothetical protein
MSLTDFITVNCGDDTTITIHPNNRVAIIEIPEQEYSYPAVNKDKQPIYHDKDKKIQAIDTWDYNRSNLTKKLYQCFNDDFDVIVFIDNNMIKKGGEFKIADEPERTFYDRYETASNLIRGVGMLHKEAPDDFVDRQYKEGLQKYGSQKNLKGTIAIRDLYGVKRGPFLHEFAHMFGQFILTTYSGYEKGQKAGPHWGVSNVGGQLGGFLDRTLKSPFTDSSLTTPASGQAGWYQANNGVSNSFDPDASINDKPYAPLELYLMGLMSKDEAREKVGTIKVFKNPEFQDPKNYEEGKFYAEGFDTYTIENIVEQHGERIPNSEESQKEFRMLFVVVTSSSRAPLTEKIPRSNGSSKSLLDDVDDIVEEMTRKDNIPGGKYNFYMATDKRATIKADGLFEALKKN